MKRGRRSTADVESANVIDITGRRSIGIVPPSWLGDDERTLFAELVSQAPPRSITQADAPLLATYCSAIIVNRNAARDLKGGKREALSTWERSAKIVAQLASKLRFAPHARTHAVTAARRVANQPEGISTAAWLQQMEGKNDD